MKLAYLIPATIIVLIFTNGIASSQEANTPTQIREIEIPKPEVSVFFHLGDKIVSGWLAFLNWLGKTFDPIVGPIFRPMSKFLERTYQPWAKICALGLFVGTMLWVWFGMKKEYVNLGRNKESIWTDLRWWTIFSMLPHVIVYLYF
ncbi:MAG: hypothetical protein N3G21_08580 [Candidatus Hydrogenedentes bacterium]|nr:hypothetical protein [Candidatus Hydrogenedentota bacterium]